MPRPKNIFSRFLSFFGENYGIIAGMVASAALAVEDIPASAAPLVRKARRKPVALSQNGGKTVAAYLVSAKTYREMAELAEDAYWVREIPKIIKRNKKHGYLSAEETRKRMDDILSS